MNITEKILVRAADKIEITPGEIIEASVDLAMSHDGTSPPTIKTFNKIAKQVWDPQRIVIVFDHNIPANNIGSAEFQRITRFFAREQGIKNIYNHGEGICHHVLPEKGFVEPGKLIVGADSHTCTYGAFGAFATGMGATDMAMIYATGKTWLMVPESYRMEITGSLQNYTTPKDLILNIIGNVGADGATYKAVEFTGDTIDSMDVAGRMTICNMVVEMGAKNGIMEPNKPTIKFLKERIPHKFPIKASDKGSEYEKEFHFEVESLEPQVACPHDVDNVKPLNQIKGTHIDQAFLGSCTNGSFKDLKEAADILEGKKVHDDVRMIVVPASSEIYNQAVQNRLISIFIESGAIVCNPGCGPCLGAHMGVLAPEEVSISTTNRNFQGRMGDPDSKIYLANPAVVASSAIKGEITHPSDFF